MTRQKHLKQLVRDRMAKTGERYTAARRFLLRGLIRPHTPHLPGLVPATTALRVLLTHAGVVNPHTGEPFTEAMLFGLAGGVGIGVFAFYYEKHDFASFFVAGRHLWHDHLAYLKNACRRLGAEVVVKESSGGKSAEKQLREMLNEHGPCVAWVDMLGLPYRGVTATEGNAYHVVTVYSIDDQAGTALVGDLTDEPVEVALADLAAARGRIKKDKHRLLAISSVKPPKDLKPLIADALKACHAGLTGEGAPKSAKRNFSLDALTNWADRLTSTKDADRWERVFAPGHRLWTGLTSIHQYVEHYGGGGLARPLMADFLNEASLDALAKRYADLGERWSELADAALYDGVPAFKKAKAVFADYAEEYHSGTPESRRAVWDKLDALKKQVTDCFPLSEKQYADLRAELAERVRSIHAAEVAAHNQLSRSSL